MAIESEYVAEDLETNRVKCEYIIHELETLHYRNQQLRIRRRSDITLLLCPLVPFTTASLIGMEGWIVLVLHEISISRHSMCLAGFVRAVHLRAVQTLVFEDMVRLL